MAVIALNIILVVCTFLLTGSNAVACPSACSCISSQQQQSLTDDGIAVICSQRQLTSVHVKLPLAAASLDVSDNRLEVLDNVTLPHTGVHGLSTANFSRNRIVTIATGSFSRWSKLVSLDLSANRLASIDHGTFRGAAETSLQNLDLSGNRLTDVDGGFSGMTNLFRLDLRNNYLTSLTEFTFRGLSGLRYLFLTNNRIYRIERRALRHLHHLLYLVLRGNPLADTDRLHFHTPSTLSYIDLSECGLTSIPRGLPGSLRYVQLRRNNLTSLDADVLSECRHVNILVLDENKIHSVNDGTFATLSHLQQLWLNENQLTKFPRPLPVSLRRLLVDNNRLMALEDADAFPVRSQMTTLSLAGNQLQRLTPTVLHRLANLQSLDLSNNQLRSINRSTFSGNTNMRSLTLAKNPLEVIQTDGFSGLRSLKALTLSYVPSGDVQLAADDLFRPLSRLSRLDLDNSPGIAKSVFSTSLSDVRPSSVEELGLMNCDLSTLPREFPRKFPRLSALRISSARWHCDRALIWFRDWLLDPGVDVRVQSLPDIRCATPDSVRYRPLVSLNNDEFVHVTSTSSAPSSTSSTTTTTSPAHTTSRPRTSSQHPPADPSNDDYLNHEEVVRHRMSTQYSSARSTGDVWMFGGDVERVKSTPLRRNIDANNSRSTTPKAAVGQSLISTSRSPHHRSGHGPHSHHVKHGSHHNDNRNHHHDDDDNDDVDSDERLTRFQTRLIITVVPVAATIVVAAFIVAAIIYFWRRSDKPAKPSTPPPPPLSASAAYDDDTLTNGGVASTPRTFIKYKNKNGVLLFSTPADSPSSLTTAVPDDTTPDSCLIGETSADGTGTIRYVLPPSSAGYKTRVYRWEDF